MTRLKLETGFTGMTFTTDQEAFWAGEFGNAYMERNQGDDLLASNLNFFSRR